jgi:type I restriction enzyme M protein
VLDFVDNQLFATLKNLSADPVRNPRGYVVRGVFEDAYNYMKSGHLLRQVINKLNAIDFNRQAERHQFNDLYEKILKDLQSAGNAGEFYTPRAVTQFMVDMVNPQLGEKVLDPATGTGGFLVCAIEHLRKQVQTPPTKPCCRPAFAASRKSSCPTCCASPTCCCTASRCPAHPARQHPGPPAARPHPGRPRGRGLTNPPFGGIEEPASSNFPADVRTKETADLFLVLIKHILKVNGRAALVLPDGTLFGEGVKTRIKEQLLAECNLHTIVRLPNGVFAPYTGIKTNLLFFTKGTPTRTSGTTSTRTRRGEELQQDQAHPHRRVRRRESLVGQRGRWLCRPRGKRARLEGQHRRRSRPPTTTSTRRTPTSARP